VVAGLENFLAFMSDVRLFKSDKIMLVGAMAALLFTGCLAPQLFGSEKPRMANPASVYCANAGYRTQMRAGPDGSQYGICIFFDGNECEEWAFFRANAVLNIESLKNRRLRGSAEAMRTAAVGPT
jgi:putative hemolysin